MKADDLRIGNWVKDIKKGYVSIHGIEPNWDEVWLNYCHGSGIYKKRIIEIEPIPLTEELLKKCGFTKVGSNYEKDWLLLHTHLEKQIFDFLLYESSSGKLKATPILYLHRLQNLYFALTGEELEINLEEK